MKRVFLFSLIISAFVISADSLAQEKEGITITTRPPGATVYLDGEYNVVANTPARLPLNISGRYKVKITRPGFETWSGELTLLPGSGDEITINLGKKTRFKALIRSLFIPGWGQTYSDNKRKGLLFTAGALTSGATYYFFNQEFSKKKTDYEIALDDYNQASSIDDKLRLKAIADDFQRKAYNAETDRNSAIAILAGVWAFNMLDAVVFFPEGQVLFPKVTASNDGASITLTARF